MASSPWGPSQPGENSLFTFMLDAAEKSFPELREDDDGNCECDELAEARKKLAEAKGVGPERLHPLAVLRRVHQTLMEHTGNINKTVLQDMLDDVEDCLYWQGKR